MAWFDDAFLESLFSKAGSDNAIWLTAKQGAVCCRYMAETEVIGKYGYRHSIFSYTWRGRSVTYSHSKKNGCGTIIFGLTPKECKKEHEEFQERKKKDARHLLEWRAENATERFLNEMSRLKESILTLEAEIQELQDELSEENLSEKERDTYTWSMGVNTDELEEKRKKLAEYEDVLAHTATSRPI